MMCKVRTILKNSVKKGRIPKYRKEMKYEEISEIMGTSVGALKASYHHAVKKIHAFLLEKL